MDASRLHNAILEVEFTLSNQTKLLPCACWPSQPPSWPVWLGSWLPASQRQLRELEASFCRQTGAS